MIFSMSVSLVFMIGITTLGIYRKNQPTESSFGLNINISNGKEGFTPADGFKEFNHQKLYREDQPCGTADNPSTCHKPYSTCVNGSCVHKDLFPMFSPEIIGLVTLSVLMMLCTVAGIGGGGITIPIL